MEKPKNCTGPNIRRYREAAGLTRTALSRALREQGFIISPRRIRKMEEQSTKVYEFDLIAFARLFHIRAGDLFDV